MPERSQTGVAENDVKAHRQDRVDQRLSQQGEQERGKERRRDGEEKKNNRRHHQSLSGEKISSHHARPQSHVAHNARTAAIGAKCVKYDNSGKSAVAKLSRKP